MITITKTFDDALLLDDFIKNYFKEYHPAGYGTQIREVIATPIFDEGEFQYINFVVTITRFESCD